MSRAPTTVNLSARPRTLFGKKCGALRRSGWVPANVFGPGAPSVAIEIAAHDIAHLLTHVRRTALLSLAIEGQKDDATVLVTRVDRRPTNDELYHVDLYRVSMTHTLHTTVPIVLVGDAPAVRTHEATVLHELNSLSIECLPGDIPEQIEVNIEALVEIDDAIFVRDLTLPPKVTVLASPDEMIVHAVRPRVIEEGAPGEEAAAEGEAAPEGEAEAEGEPGAEEKATEETR
ncbi:MAG TPA: 50S ribosomal protein L25 [Chloroflexota bacterium]